MSQMLHGEQQVASQIINDLPVAVIFFLRSLLNFVKQLLYYDTLSKSMHPWRRFSISDSHRSSLSLQHSKRLQRIEIPCAHAHSLCG